MLKLNIEPPSHALLSALQLTMSEELPEYVPGYDYLEPLVADGIYFHSRVADIGKNQYQDLFDEEIFVMGMILRPYPWVHTNYVKSYYRPHRDFGRTLGLNYLLDCGGNNVTTTMYEPPKEPSLVVPFESVEPIESYVLDKHVWYGLDAASYHSVENIEHDRLMLTISFKELTIAQFAEKYKHLVIW